jgi:hypothetical protein
MYVYHLCQNLSVCPLLLLLLLLLLSLRFTILYVWQRVMKFEVTGRTALAQVQVAQMPSLDVFLCLHSCAGNYLYSLCHRAMPVSLKAKDVLAKLRTPFARHFKAHSLEPGSHTGKEGRYLPIYMQLCTRQGCA